MRRPDVFDVMIARPPISSIRAYSFCLIARFSMIASITTSLAATAAARSSSRLPTLTSVSKRGEKNAAGLALRAPSRPAAAILLRAARSPAGASLAGMSSSRTRSPALARCAAMAAPMTPAPSTVTSRIGSEGMRTR
jgi:hypothetical protein